MKEQGNGGQEIGEVGPEAEEAFGKIILVAGETEAMARRVAMLDGNELKDHAFIGAALNSVSYCEDTARSELDLIYGTLREMAWNSPRPARIDGILAGLPLFVDIVVERAFDPIITRQAFTVIGILSQDLKQTAEEARLFFCGGPGQPLPTPTPGPEIQAEAIGQA